MKRLVAAFTLCSVLLIGISIVAAAQSNTDFSGTWVLDMKRTSDIPSELKSYRLIVKQDEKQISFESKIEGHFGPPAGQDQNRTAPQTTLNQSPSTSSPNSTVGGISLNTADSGGSLGSSRAVIARGRALATTIRRMTCTLDGKEMVREVSGISPGKIRRKALWKKGDKMLELNVARDFESQGSPITSTVREIWELAEDGKILKIKRTVNLLAGWDETTLIFSREPANP